LELGTKVGFGALQPGELLTLVAHEHPPRQADDQHTDDYAQANLGLLRPATDVVEVELFEVDLFLAHDAAPAAGAAVVSVASPVASLAAGAASPASSAAASAGSTVSGAAAPASAIAGTAPSTGVASASAVTAGTGSGIPSPSSSFGAFGLASLTISLNSYGRPLSVPRASMIDSSGLVIQPEPSRLRI